MWSSSRILPMFSFTSCPICCTGLGNFFLSYVIPHLEQRGITQPRKNLFAGPCISTIHRSDLRTHGATCIHFSGYLWKLPWPLQGAGVLLGPLREGANWRATEGDILSAITQRSEGFIESVRRWPQLRHGLHHATLGDLQGTSISLTSLQVIFSLGTFPRISTVFFGACNLHGLTARTRHSSWNLKESAALWSLMSHF